jgi:hypothetical protein
MNVDSMSQRPCSPDQNKKTRDCEARLTGFQLSLGTGSAPPPDGSAGWAGAGGPVVIETLRFINQDLASIAACAANLDSETLHALRD